MRSFAISFPGTGSSRPILLLHLQSSAGQPQVGQTRPAPVEYTVRAFRSFIGSSLPRCYSPRVAREGLDMTIPLRVAIALVVGVLAVHEAGAATPPVPTVSGPIAGPGRMYPDPAVNVTPN